MENNTVEITDKNIDQCLKTLELDYTTLEQGETIKWSVETLNRLDSQFKAGKISEDKYNSQRSSHLKEVDHFIMQAIKDQLTKEQNNQLDKIENSIGLFELGERVYKARKEIQNQVSSNNLQALSWNEIVTKELKAKEYILEPLIREKDIVMLYAERGVGKTLVSTGVAWAIANATEFLGWNNTNAKRTLFIDGEMPLISIRDRIKLLSNSIDNENFKVLSHDTLLDTQTMPDLSTTAGQETISHLTDWAEFIVLDNLATLCRTGQENTTEAWKITQTWLLQLRSKGKTILVVDHAGKNGKNRGASAKQDVLDTVISLKHPSDYEENQGARFVVNIEKNRNANPIESIEAHLVDGNTWNVSNAKQSREEQVIQLLNDGLSQTEIAEEVGCNKSTVCRIKKKYEEQQKYLKK